MHPMNITACCVEDALQGGHVFSVGLVGRKAWICMKLGR